MTRKRIGALALACLLAGCLATSAGASAHGRDASADERPRPQGKLTPQLALHLPIGLYTHVWTIDADGSFWIAKPIATSGIQVLHVDADGDDLGDGFSFTTPIYSPLGIALAGNRIVVSAASSTDTVLHTWNRSGGDHQSSDGETSWRMGFNGAGLRSEGGGTVRIATGQSNKVMLVNGADGDSSPFYPQVVMGAAINEVDDAPTDFLVCSVAGASGDPHGPCGERQGAAGPNAGQLERVVDTARSPSVLYVLQGGADAEVTTILEPAHTLLSEFGSVGSGNGQLSEPISMVRDPAGGHLFVAELGNRRISEFTESGTFVAAHGNGVLTGTDAFESCGPAIGPCRAGVSDKSYFWHLAIGPDGRLYAQAPKLDSPVFDWGDIVVLAISPDGPPPPPPPTPADTVTLKAKPLKVVKGAKTTLTAKLTTATGCPGRRVRFQVKKQSGWSNLGGAKAVTAGCQADRTKTITQKTKFRVLLLAATPGDAATSPVVTVKLK